MDIEYDSAKAASNLNKHGVSFEEAVSVLLDENALAMEDERSIGENRWLIIGMSDQIRLLTVVYTLRGEKIRLISARKATKREANDYG